MSSLTIAIIIGIITVIYSKSKNVNKGATKAEPFSFNRGNLQDIYMKLKEASIPDRSGYTQTETALSKIENGEDTDKKVQIEDISSVNITNQKVMKTAEAEKINPGSTVNDLEDNKKLVNAVIWSEILGEPRSKKPYNARRR